MPFPIRLRLRSLLPMLLAGVASLGFLVVFGYRRAQETRHARLVNAEILKGQAIALRNTVSDLLATHHPEQAERRLLDATLDPRVRVLALVNREGRVLISNRRRWLDQPGSVLDDFAPAKAGQALAHAIDLFEPVGASHVAGYFPLEPDLGESALREPERGLLYASYDLTPDLEQARYRVRLEGGWIFAYFSLAALLTYLLLDRWVTRKIDRMVRTMQRVAEGDLDARTGLAGAGELDALGRAFDHLLDHNASTRKALQDNLAFQDTVLETIPDVVFVKDARDLTFVRVNRAAERMLGLDRHEIIGRHVADLLPAPDATASDLEDRAVLAGGRMLDLPERVIHTPRLGERTVHTTKVPMLDAEGAPRHLLGVIEDITERRHAELLERERTADFRRLMEVSPLPVALSNPAGGIDFLSRRFTQLFGYGAADLPDLAHWWRAAYPDPACREQAERLWDDAIARASAAGDGIVQTERTFDVMCLDGSTRTVEIRGTLLGERVLVVFNDLTERVKDEQRVRDALALSEKLLATMPLGVAAYQGLSGRCVLANAAILQIVGGTLDYHLSQDFRQIRQWQETGLLAVAERALGTGEDQQIEVHALTRAGRDCWLACSLSSFQSGGAPHLLALVSDVTARRQAEETLRASEARFRTLTEQAPIPLFVQQDDVYVYCNPAALRLLHAPDEAAVLGRPSLDIVHPDDRPGTGEVIQQRREGRLRTDRHPERFVALDGAIIDVEVIGAPISLGGRAAMLVFAEDVTARNRDERLRRTLEQELNRSQKLQSLGSLAGGVAHDMNNVLGAILNLATLHRDKAPEGSPLRQSMETIARACLRGGTMVKGLLGFAREGLAEERPLDLNELVREEVALLERTTLQKVRLEMDLAEGLRAVIGDASALAHALMNLCVNAVDAMPDGGTLSIRTGNEPGGTVLLAVGDTGCGMPAEVMEKALDPFFTTKPQGKGTGLGLSIVYGTVKAHGGQLQLKSAPGEGTVVEIRLPAWTAGPAPAPPEEAPDRAQRSKRILVVDDDELIQDSIHLLLEALGHQPVVAGSGEEALAALEAGSAFDVVILDLNMPGLGGARTLQRIRELRPALPVLLATGRADRQAVELVRTVPQVTLLAKPFSLEDLRTGLGE